MPGKVEVIHNDGYYVGREFSDNNRLSIIGGEAAHPSAMNSVFGSSHGHVVTYYTIAAATFEQISNWSKDPLYVRDHRLSFSRCSNWRRD